MSRTRGRKHRPRKASETQSPKKHKPRFARAADGRIGRPDVFEYETADGYRHAVQPRDGRAYRVIVHDQAAYQRLIDTGWLYGPEHAGPAEPIIDARKTTG